MAITLRLIASNHRFAIIQLYSTLNTNLVKRCCHCKHIVWIKSTSLMTNYPLMSTQIISPSAKPPLMCTNCSQRMSKQDLYSLQQGSKMFIRVAMIHCGERLLHTHSPQISLLHLPRPARTRTLHLFSLRIARLPEEEILIYYNLAEAINHTRKEDPSFVSA